MYTYAYRYMYICIYAHFLAGYVYDILAPGDSRAKPRFHPVTVEKLSNWVLGLAVWVRAQGLRPWICCKKAEFHDSFKTGRSQHCMTIQQTGPASWDVQGSLQRQGTQTYPGLGQKSSAVSRQNLVSAIGVSAMRFWTCHNMCHLSQVLPQVETILGGSGKFRRIQCQGVLPIL